MNTMSSNQPDIYRPTLSNFIEPAEIESLIEAARREDLGPNHLDVTTSVCIVPTLMATAQFVVRQPGCVCGLALWPAIAKAYAPGVELETQKADGDRVEPGEVLATMRGPLNAILMTERVALNVMTHLSGIATLTQRFVDRVESVEGSRAKICDTRKTLPGWRGLQKYAVVCGGGTSHRSGLYDAMLIKDNHIAHIPAETLGDAIRYAVQQARSQYADLKFIEVEVDDLKQLEQVLDTAVDMVLLDNMPPQVLRQAVALRDRLAPSVLLEASGAVNLNTVAAIAETGVERISVGALTHSAPALDIGLDIKAS